MDPSCHRVESAPDPHAPSLQVAQRLLKSPAQAASHHQSQSPQPTTTAHPTTMSERNLQAHQALQAQAQQERERILAAAAEGSGVQPWERDWPLSTFDLHGHVVCDWDAGPTLLEHLITMANWALRSPQGRQALLQDRQPTNPWQHTLDTVRAFRSGLAHRQRELLARIQNDETWPHRWPLGDFDLFEHLVSSADFNPDWFTTGELLEMAEWALCAPEARGTTWPEEAAFQGGTVQHGAVLAVIATVRAALTVRQQRLLLDQARQTLPVGSDQLRQLEQRFAASTGLSSD